MDNFLPYIWYDLKCLDGIGLAKNAVYTVDILTKKYDPTKDCFIYERFRDVTLTHKWRNPTDTVHLHWREDNMPDNIRPLAFMLIGKNFDNTVCPEIVTKLEAESDDTCKAHRSGLHSYDDRGLCYCGAALSTESAVESGR